jgi:ATP-dependent DNA helicase RecQ
VKTPSFRTVTPPRQYGRVTDTGLEREALDLLRQLTGNPSSEFRPDQMEVIRRLVGERQRVLLVQRTGWGKSAVYFIATRMVRDRGGGPTLLVSPLLALMRNQIEAATRMGVRAVTINSANREEWDDVADRLDGGAVDILLISPERLANPQFRAEVLPEVGKRSGLLVIDEAHCISDWGHDFRPDYRRLVRVLDLLPTGVPVLCCTATANDRVVADVTAQLGSDLHAVRGPLARDGLGLHVLELPSQARRLVWLSETIPRLPGTGIVYCLTIRDTERVTGWLRAKGIEAVAYSSATDDARRPEIEQALLANELKVVVATSALGMGFDKPDLAFVIHYQSPGSPIAYYQQVGRAGRALPESLGVLLRGVEDGDIQDYFIRAAFPSADLSRKVVELLEARAEPVRAAELLDEVNLRPSQLDLLLKTLEVDGAIERDGSRWLRTLRPWTFDHERVESVTALRRTEQAQMGEYAAAAGGGCRMTALRRYLDDPSGAPCGRCDVCTATSLAVDLPPEAVEEAIRHLRSSDVVVETRKQLPDRRRIPLDRRPCPGRALSVLGDGGWGGLVRDGRRAGGPFDDRLVGAAVDLIRRRWRPDPFPTWVAAVPSLRLPRLVPELARRLAEALDLPWEDVLVRVRDTESQRTMHNSAQQYGNVRGTFTVAGSVPEGPVLLVDDIVDSRWTMTAIAWKLLDAGSGPVHPFALADGAGTSA